MTFNFDPWGYKSPDESHNRYYEAVFRRLCSSPTPAEASEIKKELVKGFPKLMESLSRNADSWSARRDFLEKRKIKLIEQAKEAEVSEDALEQIRERMDRQIETEYEMHRSWDREDFDLYFPEDSLLPDAESKIREMAMTATYRKFLKDRMGIKDYENSLDYQISRNWY